MNTAFSDSGAKRAARDDRPPNLSTISETLRSIGTENGTTSSYNQELFVQFRTDMWFSRIAGCGSGIEIGSMFDQKLDKAAWTKSVFKRICGLIHDMGMTEEEFVKEYHTALGHSNPKAVKQYFDRGSIPAFQIILFARKFDIDIAYLLCLRDDLDNSFKPRGLYGLQRDLAAYKKSPQTKPAKGA